MRAAPAQPQETAARKLAKAASAQPRRTAARKLIRATPALGCAASRKQLTQSRVELRLHSFQFDFTPCSFFYIFVAELILQSTTATQTHVLHSDFILPLSTFTLHASPFTIHVSSFTFHPSLSPISEITPWRQSPYVVFTDLAFLKGVGGRGVSL